MKAFINGKALVEGKIKDDVVVLFDKRIKEIANKVAKDTEIIDLAGNYLFPGFIDIHVHGAAGGDVMDATPQGLEALSQSLAKSGVTRFLATTMTMPVPDIRCALENVKQVIKDDQLTGAKPLGVHLEGPYISAKFCGGQDAKHIKKPDWADIADYTDIIKIITLAVEEDSDCQFIAHNPGIVLSIGHSAASFEQALASYKLGVRHCTHFFNAMSGLHHRAPGIVGAVFSKPYATEIIADGIHIHPQFLNTIVNLVGKENIILISDSMRATGLQPGRYELGGQPVIVNAESARLASGQLAGSILTLDRAVRNMVDFTDCSLVDIVEMATLNAARSIAVDGNYGAIKKAAVADFVVMDDAFNVISTWRDGNCIYQRNK